MAYHLFAFLGLIAQGLLQILALRQGTSLWGSFRSWLRTIKPGSLPSETVTARILENSYSDFLQDALSEPIFKKFLTKHLDLKSKFIPQSENIDSG